MPMDPPLFFDFLRICSQYTAWLAISSRIKELDTCDFSCVSGAMHRHLVQALSFCILGCCREEGGEEVLVRLDQGGEELTVPRDSIYQVLTAYGDPKKLTLLIF